MGLALRYAALGEAAGFDYRNLLHAHSHIAALGWAYQMMYLLLVRGYVPESRPEGNRSFGRLFIVTQLSVVGMMVSFPLQGYGLYSIIFSALHIMCTFVFVFLLVRHSVFRNNLEKAAIRAFCLFLILTTAGIIGLAASIKFYGKGSVQYLLSIQFYLHFLFSGAFVFGLLAVLFRKLPDEVKDDSVRKGIQGIYWIALSVLFGFSLPMMWFYPGEIWYTLYGVSVFQQAAGAVLLYRSTGGLLSEGFRRSGTAVRVLLAFSTAGFIAKVLIQSALVFPLFITAAFEIRNLFIGYIHLLMLGTVSGAMLCIVVSDSSSDSHQHVRYILPSALFVAGVFATEIVIFIQGLAHFTGFANIPNYPLLLFVLSSLILLSVVLFLLRYAIMFRSEMK